MKLAQERVRCRAEEESCTQQWVERIDDDDDVAFKCATEHNKLEKTSNEVKNTSKTTK